MRNDLIHRVTDCMIFHTPQPLAWLIAAVPKEGANVHICEDGGEYLVAWSSLSEQDGMANLPNSETRSRADKEDYPHHTPDESINGMPSTLWFTSVQFSVHKRIVTSTTIRASRVPSMLCLLFKIHSCQFCFPMSIWFVAEVLC